MNQNESGISDSWRLCDEYTVRQAALLFAECDPSSNAGTECDNWKPHERPDGYEAAKQAISAALRKGVITGTNVLLSEYDINGNPYRDIPSTTDIAHSTVDRESLISWLYSRGKRNGFFFPDANPDTPGYLDPNHPRYTGKLAATVNAWLAVEVALPKKSEKQSLEIWLRSNAGRFGLTDDEGNPISAAMTECATVANWKTVGGATPTPGA